MLFAKQIRGEDRLFTTSVAVNALLSTWTLYNSVNRTITWKRSESITLVIVSHADYVFACPLENNPYVVLVDVKRH